MKEKSISKELAKIQRDNFDKRFKYNSAFESSKNNSTEKDDKFFKVHNLTNLDLTIKEKIEGDTVHIFIENKGVAK